MVVDRWQALKRASTSFEDVLFGREVEADGRCPMKIRDGPANAPKGATVQRRPSAVRPVFVYPAGISVARGADTVAG